MSVDSRGIIEALRKTHGANPLADELDRRESSNQEEQFTGHREAQRNYLCDSVPLFVGASWRSATATPAS